MHILSKFSEWRARETEKLVRLDGDLGKVNSINITMFSAGKQHNVIPETAEATIDIRVSPLSSLAEIEAEINKYTAVNGVTWSYYLKHDSSAISTIHSSDIYWSAINSALKER